MCPGALLSLSATFGGVQADPAFGPALSGAYGMEAQLYTQAHVTTLFLHHSSSPDCLLESGLFWAVIFSHECI